MLFDTERYIQEIEDDKRVRELKAPNNRVPALNLPKLAPEKKIVAINVSLRSIPHGLIGRHRSWERLRSERQIRLGPQWQQAEADWFRHMSGDGPTRAISLSTQKDQAHSTSLEPPGAKWRQDG